MHGTTATRGGLVALPKSAETNFQLDEIRLLPALSEIGLVQGLPGGQRELPENRRWSAHTPVNIAVEQVEKVAEQRRGSQTQIPAALASEEPIQVERSRGIRV